MTILEAAAQLRARKISAVELAQAALDRIKAVEPKLNAFITLTADHALEAAAAADRELAAGNDRGPLHGIPIALKDVFPTAGIRTTCGSKLFTDYVPKEDCRVAERLSSAGAVLLGKLNMHELAYGITSANPHFGPVRNPWDLERIPGGSSGGSGATVAAGGAMMAMGSDTGGSIRLPAAYCGVTGLKPTFGRVSRYGVLPLDFSLDHMGPLTRTARDTAVILDAIAGYDPKDDSSSTVPTVAYLPQPGVSLKGLRIGVPENFYTKRVAPEVHAAVRQMAQTAAYLGALVEPVQVPDVDALNTVGRIILLTEASATMERFLDRRSDFGPDVLTLLDQGRLLAATDYVNAQRLRRVLRGQFLDLFDKVDCLFTPTAPIPPPKIGQTKVVIGGEEEDTRLASTRFVRGVNVLGFPALSIPCGFADGVLPIGLQIIGRPWDEAAILRAGAALQDATDFHQRVPSL